MPTHLASSAALWAIAGLACALLPAALAAPAQARRLAVDGAGAVEVERYRWRVTAQVAAPDCFSRPVLMVNNQLQPTLEVTQGNILEVLVINDLPREWPEVTSGLSIHWHGFRMLNGSFWYDGTAFQSQCPIPRGGRMTYRFQVNEPPGTYLWHSHSGAHEADGLSGQLIVRPRPGSTLPHPYDEERSLHLSDWYHTLAAASAMQLNRPFDSGKVTNDSGAWLWVGTPQAILLNGRGYQGDCAIGAVGSTAYPACNVTSLWVPGSRSAALPYSSTVNPGCTHQNFTVESGKAYLFRISNSASLTYLSVCFGGHNVTVVAADARPVQPFSTACVDVNAGQRMDVLLTADQPPGAYWVAAHVQTRPGSPSGYGVLRYRGAGDSLLPSAPLPQPGSVPAWTQEQWAQVVMAQDVLDLAAANDGQLPPEFSSITVQVPQTPTLSLIMNLTQPLLNQTGQIRWAVNNVVNTNTPPCEPLGALIQRKPDWVEQHEVTPEEYNSPGYKTKNLGIQGGPGKRAGVFLLGNDTRPIPLYPTAGVHLVPLQLGDVVQVVVQNTNANSNNGDYRPGVGANRTAQEQHPFHLHGHHFWLVAQGLGVYNASTQLNLVNPPLRDTATIPQGGFIVIRFVADNPGVWPFHCHIFWHRFMGQGVTYVTAVDTLPLPPSGLPKCPKACTFNTAPWKISYVKRKYGASGFEVPAGR